MEVVIPSAVMELGAALMVELEASAAPTVKATVAESPMAEEFTFPVTVASPEVGRRGQGGGVAAVTVVGDWAQNPQVGAQQHSVSPTGQGVAVGVNQLVRFKGLFDGPQLKKPLVEGEPCSEAPLGLLLAPPPFG